MKTIVAYRSKTGYTKKYAQWIADELHCDIKEDPSYADIEGYDVIIYGGGIYAGGINGMKLITGNYSRLRGKKIALFAVGALDVSNKVYESLWNKTLSDEQQKAVGHFYFRGGFDYDRIKGADKIMISLLRSSMQKKKNPTEGQKALLSAFETADHTDRKNIAPLIEHVKGL